MQSDRFRPVTINCAPIFKPFYKSAAERWKYPFFLWSLLYQSGEKYYFWKIEKDCLLLLKKRVFGNYVLNFICPPIHMLKDTSIENEIINKYLKFGVSIDIWESMKTTYISPFGLRKVKFSNGGLEPLFETKDRIHPVNLKGRDKKGFRKLLNKYKYLIQEGSIQMSWYKNIDVIEKECLTVVQSWVIGRKSKFLTKDRSEWIQNAKKLCFPLSIIVHRDEKGKMIHFDLITEYAKGIFICELDYKDYSSPAIKNMNMSAISDYLQIQKHLDSGINVLVLGTAVQKKTLIAKTIHNPFLVQKYRIKPPFLTTKEQYNKLTEKLTDS